MSIGVLGDIVFQASAEKVLIWRDARRSGAARWVNHEVFAGKPVSEFIGPGIDQLNLSIRLDINFGIVPRDELRRLRLMRDTGTVSQFTIGGSLVGDFKLHSVDEAWQFFSSNGVLQIAIANLALEEYV